MWDDPTWGDRLDAWRAEYRRIQREENAAWRKRGEDDALVRRLRKELKAAEEAFTESDAKAHELRRRDEEMLRRGEQDGFRP